MSYVPTIEDIAYLAEHQPDKFTSAERTLRSMRHALRNGNGNVDQTTQVTVRRYYANYQLNGGQPLTESPIPREPAEGGGRQDPILGAACVECASQTPCIEKIVVACHSGENTRVTLQGEGELVNTGGKIYFVADKFVTGEGTLEDFLAGTQLKDEGNIEITLAGNCSHGQHTLTWTDELNGTELTPGTTTTVDFTVMTEPVPPITLPSALMGLLPPDAGLAFKTAVMLLDIIMNRTAMVNEQRFHISYDGTNDFRFTAVTLPQLKFDGLVTVAPPSVDTRPVTGRGGRELAAQHNMGARVRQVTERQDWGIHANLTVVCGAKNRTITVDNSPSESVTYDTGPSLRRAENQRQQQSTVERFIGTLTDASQRLAKNLSAAGSDDSKLVSFYTHGPELMLGATTEQVEEQGAPGATWKITPGLSLAYECGIRIDIYEALKRVLRALPLMSPAGAAGRSLLAFLEDAEAGRETWVVSYQFVPYLFMDVGLGVGPQPTEDQLGNHMLRADYNVQTREFERPEGQISITLRAVIAGGMMGYFDMLFADRTVFKYGVEVATSGTITIAIENGQWGYQLSHAGAMLRVQGYKKADVDSVNDRRPDDGGRPNPNRQTKHSSAQVVETTDGTRWVADGGTHAYRLAENWTGDFHAFSNGG